MSDHDAGPPPPEAAEPVAAQAPQAWRLTYAYDPDGIRLLAQQRVSMLAPPDDSHRTASARGGHWVEVRDESGHGLYRQIITNPFRTTAEVHSPDPEIGSRHVPASPEGVFQVVVPELPGAHDVVLHGLTGPGDERAQPLHTERLGETPPFEVP